MAQSEKLKIIPLGGLNEIGKNMTVFEYKDEMIIIDCGFAFPDDELLGIDIVIPDFTYVVKNKEKVKGLILTHGHEDHIGGIAFLLKEMNVPIYGTKMTLGLLSKKLEESKLIDIATLNVIKAGDRFKLGVFNIEAIRVNHSIADAVGYAIKTPVGTIVHTGDFKIDTTPIGGKPIDLTRFGQLGNHGVLALMMDSTNAERPGFAMSEKQVGDSFETLFKNSDKRILVATFASNVHRVQQAINAAVKFGRKVAISGRSMLNTVDVAIELGYIKAEKGLIINIDEIKKYPPEKLLIITTGSQGEPMSALHRMAYSDHRKVELGPTDLVIISASPIPGNEKLVNKVINELYKLGCEVIDDTAYSIHVSGHACKEELKMMLALIRPKFLIPVHGEYRHLYAHRKLAVSMGMDAKKVVVADIGKVIELDSKSCKINGSVPSGRVFVDGLGVGDVGNIVLRDRMHLAQDGLIIVVVTIDSASCTTVSGPDIVSRGFVYVREAGDLMEEMRSEAKRVLSQCNELGIRDWATLKLKLKSAISNKIYEQTKRKPMILPVIMEI